MLLVMPGHGAMNRSEPAWVTTDADGAIRVHLYFFWSKKCPHCIRARPFVTSLEKKYVWLEVHAHELSEQRGNVERYVAMAAVLGQQARSVPAFLACGRMLVGYDEAATTGRDIEQLLQQCYQLARQEPLPGREAAPAVGPPPLRVPWLGEIGPQSLSLPVLTVILAGLDSFNPCAFFVLLFLLSLLVHARSRARMLTIGITFVSVSGLVYFLFMAAWLSLFMVIGELWWVTVAAGLLAVGLGSLNIKDYFLFKRGVTLSIPDSAKPGLYQRTRALLNAERLPTLLVGTMALAIAANSYELLCTAGFPMVFTRILTLSELSAPAYYLYLLLYNIVYVVPLLLIVTVFALTMGSRKLRESEGRLLKLLSGVMMLELGLILLVAPQWLDSVSAALALLLVAATVTFVVSRVWSPATDGRGLGRA